MAKTSKRDDLWGCREGDDHRPFFGETCVVVVSNTCFGQIHGFPKYSGQFEYEFIHQNGHQHEHLVGGLEHFVSYIGNNNPNCFSYFSEGLKPPTRTRIGVYTASHYEAIEFDDTATISPCLMGQV